MPSGWRTFPAPSICSRGVSMKMALECWGCCAAFCQTAGQTGSARPSSTCSPKHSAPFLAAADRRGTRQPESQADGQRTSYAWARATNQSGQSVEAWLELGEGYQFTAASSVQAVEHVLRERPSG